MLLHVKTLGLREYEPIWEAMRSFTECRDEQSPDQLWLLEHPPVYSLGRNGDPAHLLRPSSIPLVNSDRGGQITYHGPGQLIAYVLFDLQRLGLGVRGLVSRLEDAVIATLAQYGISAQSRPDAPGVYVDGRKIASLGLRIRRACSYHGLSLNVDMDLAPFAAINPCGYSGLEVTSLHQLAVPVRTMDVAVPLIGQIIRQFGFTAIQTRTQET
jgi:lipoyl(octanoyl) transferase